MKEVKYREVERVMTAAGWIVLRTSGSHVIWRSPDGASRLSVPRHNKVSAGVIRQIVKALPETPSSWR